jgi:hypothetical protein
VLDGRCIDSGKAQLVFERYLQDAEQQQPRARRQPSRRKHGLR